MPHAALRITPSALQSQVYDLSGWLAGLSTRWVVAAEVGSKTQKPHLHYYIETDVCDKTLRNRIAAAFTLTKGVRGKASAEYCLKYNSYKDPSPAYVVKENHIFGYAGYTREEMDEYVAQGNARWGPGRFQDLLDAVDLNEGNLGMQIEESELRVSTTPAAALPLPPDRRSSGEHSEWDRLLKAYRNDPGIPGSDSLPGFNKYRSMAQIQTWIKAFYLVRSRPIPRAGDLRRYSYSLWAISHNKVDERDIWEADNHERVCFAEEKSIFQ